MWSRPSETMHQQQHKLPQTEKALKMVNPATDSFDSNFLAELLKNVNNFQVDVGLHQQLKLRELM